MIRRLIPLVTLIMSGSAMAQIGIGTKNAASSAQLEVVALKKGVLLPRVELKQIDDFSPIEGEKVESLLVYHTGNSNLVAGFYYWKSNAWTPLLSGETFIDRKNNTFTIEGNPTKNGEESLVITDSENHSVYLAVAEIANNSTFITNLTENNEFVTKLGDNIDFIEKITNNNEFIENIINNLRGKYGNVNYNATTHTFVYYDDNGVEHDIDWSSLNTVNLRFELLGDYLVITDSEQQTVQLAVAEIANNSTFISNLTENNEFITKLGDNIDFIEKITNNNEFIENIINNLKGKYGNVNYNATTHTFVYYDDNGVEHDIDWSSLNTVNLRFELLGDYLVITDSEQQIVQLAVAEIANNSTFITNLTENNEFITKLGDNIDFIEKITNNNEFIENIINNLKGKYGNVGYDTGSNSFFYYDAAGQPVPISWDVLGNTKIKSFVVTADFLTITDTDDNEFKVAIDELGKIIANNDVFVTELVNNQKFITELGDNIDFINQITNNSEFIENIINELKGKYGNVGFDTGSNSFFYYDAAGQPVPISWDVLGNTKIKSFVVTADFLTITDTDDNEFKVSIDELGKIIANNDVFVTELVNNQKFITELGDNIDFINQITNNSEFIENIINELKGKYGNVGFDTGSNSFFYYDAAGQPVPISWDVLGNTKIKSFVVTADFLTITDTDDNEFKVSIDELGKIIANNDVFVTELVNNQKFITELGDNIDFINQITNNSEFIENIINELKGKYGNVGFDTGSNSFFYYDAAGQPVPISWDVLGNTKIKSFVVTADFLTITDTDNNEFKVAIDELGRIIANNDVFVTELVNNPKFITELGDNIDFINQITNNSEFIENIINELKGKYGNVGFDTGSNSFFYYDAAGQPVPISWDVLGNTKIKSFVVTADFLTITDTDDNEFKVAIDELGRIIANNDVFVTELVNNPKFITELGDNLDFINYITNKNEFIENIINKLEKNYGNVGYDTVTNQFYYLDDQGNKQTINLENAVKLYESLTSLENIVTQETNVNGEVIDVYTLTYKDEKGILHPIDIDVLVKGNETLTSLVYDPVNHVLIYTNENLEESQFKLKDLVGNVETLTKLEFDSSINSLLFTDERNITQTIDLNSINKHPWYDSTTQKIATSNTADIYTKGWVGIGYTEPSGAPNERLRVNGSITAVNSYYADYVFENYFDGFSSLKYDYDFKSLDAVEAYIKTNRHLPGITPIHELTKLEEGYAFNVSELSIQLLEKTEELYLHIIDQKNELEEKELQLKQLEKSNRELQEQMEQQNREMSEKIDRLEQMLINFMQ